jgi:glycosyltransferase involved in cell wall biosynthesis
VKIVHIITRMILGGAQENTLLSCAGLMGLGHEVRLLTGPTEGPEGELLSEAARRGVPVETVPDLVRPISPLRDFRAYRALRRRIAELSPEVVHTHSSKAGFLGRAAARAALVPAVVHTVHGLPFHPYMCPVLARAYILAERWAARHCDRLVSVAEAMTDQAVAAGVAPRGKFVTIHSGMEVAPFLAARARREELRRRLGYGPGDFVLAKLARLFELKGHDQVIAAAAELRFAHPELRLLFLGDGKLRAEIEARARAAGLADRVKFAGLVPAAEVPAHLAAADLLVHASLREGLPRAVPQALLAGVPVVAVDVDGSREVIQDGRTGLLVPPCQPSALATAIRRMIEDPGFAAGTAAAGRELCSRLFPAEAMVKRLAALYSEILEEKKRGASGIPKRPF